MLASSRQDLEDNSHYFKTATQEQEQTKPKIENTREYILTGYNTLELSDYSAKRLGKIQANLLNLKKVLQIFHQITILIQLSIQNQIK